MDRNDEIVECACGKDCRLGDMERIYDGHGIYVGRRCSQWCPELASWNLDYTDQDAAENGEQIEPE